MSKRALIVGINEFRPGIRRLRGCVNDTGAMQQTLTTYYDFDPASIKVICDRDATAEAIREGLGWLLRDYAGDGSDVRVFHFSSHGTQVDDQSGDEWECVDEVIVPYDHDWENPFRDDHLREIFDTIPESVNFTFIADCCHSGSIQRVLLERDIEFEPRYLTPPAEVTDSIEELRLNRDRQADAWAAQELAEMLQNIPPAQWASRMQEYLTQLRKRFRENNYAIVTEKRHVLLAACEDRQTAADARIDGDFCGAFTWGLTKAIKEANGDLTYKQLVRQTAANLRDYSQRPQLECPDELRGVKLFAPLGS